MPVDLLTSAPEMQKYLEEQRQKNRSAKTIAEAPHPFLKWAGGKRQLLPQMNSYLPKTFGTYFEPFVGAGALYFYLLPDHAVLMDTNAELINTYHMIRDHVEDLILSLKKHRNEADYFYQVRDADREANFEKWSRIEKASRTIFMNKCCFNGLYRVNSQGYFNVPFGKYVNPTFCDEENLRAVNKVLQGAEIRLASYEKVLEWAKKGDFIYFDPPYQPLSKTANFTGYTKDSFGPEDQTKLRDVFVELDRRGCHVMLSNSYSELILELYKKYRIIPLNAKRAINCDASKRGQIPEALVLNY